MSELQTNNTIARLESEIERLRDGVGSLTLMLAARDTEIERLQKEWAILQKDWTICWEGCGELRADNDRLQASLQLALAQNYCSDCGRGLDSSYIP